MAAQFVDFLETVDPQYAEFVSSLHQQLLEAGCRLELKEAKSGFVASYLLPVGKKTLANYVSRKSGMRLRLYAAHCGCYQDLLDALPLGMKKEIVKASPCKRLENSADCNSKCPMGYTFALDGVTYQKCRQMAFFLPLSQENNPYLQALAEKELACALTERKE